MVANLLLVILKNHLITLVACLNADHSCFLVIKSK